MFIVICKQCGKQIPDDAQYCEGCGAPVKPVEGEVQENKVIFILAYLGILFFLPLVTTPNSKAGRFHANQGLVLLITGIAGQIVFSILQAITWRLWILVSLLSTVWGIALFALMVIGMINANKGLQKPLPVIGNIRILK
jgi:uncharacterized membrane protein